MTYRTLKAGEKIRKGDQFYCGMHRWEKATSIGLKVTIESPGVFRRLPPHQRQ